MSDVEPQRCEVCGKENVPLIPVEVDIDGHRSWHYACSEECLQQIEDVAGEEEEDAS